MQLHLDYNDGCTVKHIIKIHSLEHKQVQQLHRRHITANMSNIVHKLNTKQWLQTVCVEILEQTRAQHVLILMTLACIEKTICPLSCE